MTSPMAIVASFAVPSERHTQGCFTLILFISFNFMCVCFVFMCICVRVHTVLAEASKAHWIYWNWSYRCLLATMWVPGIKSRSSATSILSCWVISPAPYLQLETIYSRKMKKCHKPINQQDGCLFLLSKTVNWIWRYRSVDKVLAFRA